jgi:hypothetical protein
MLACFVIINKPIKHLAKIKDHHRPFKDLLTAKPIENEDVPMIIFEKPQGHTQ